MKNDQIIAVEELRERTGIFLDRDEAGQVLSGLVLKLDLRHPLVLAIPAGGVPVAVPLAEALACPLDVAVVSKITLPWNSEAGYGAVAFDGSYLLNDAMIHSAGLDENEVARGIEDTRQKINNRVKRLRQGRPVPELENYDVVVVDDGLASGYTMHAAVAALRRAGAKHLTAAVPTGYQESLTSLAKKVDKLCCANVRSGSSFAVASAFRHWRDVGEVEAELLLRDFARA